MSVGRYEVCVKLGFSAAHSLRGVGTRCENLHGHNWVVEVSVEGRRLDSKGICIDFRDLKEMVREVVDRLDHQYLNKISPFDRINPSAENLAEYIFEELERKINQSELSVVKVEVSESESHKAVYTRG